MEKKPLVYTDTFLVFLAKVIKEIHLHESEWVVLEREDLFRDDDDMQNLGRIQNHLKDVYYKVSNGYLTGTQGVDMLRDVVFEPYRDLIVRLTESRKFPELYALYHLCS